MNIPDLVELTLPQRDGKTKFKKLLAVRRLKFSKRNFDEKLKGHSVGQSGFGRTLVWPKSSLRMIQFFLSDEFFFSTSSHL